MTSVNQKNILHNSVSLAVGFDGKLYLVVEDGSAHDLSKKTGMRLACYGGYENALEVPQ